MQERKRIATAPRKRKNDRPTRLFRALGLLALALGVLTVTLFVVEYSRGLASSKASDALLVAYEAKPTPDPTVTVAATATAEPTAEVDATESPGIDGHGEVDESADYVQLEGPDEDGTVHELIQKIIDAEGEDGVIGLIEIPALDVRLPIIGKWSYPLLKISICRYTGPLPNNEGHLVLLGHNYKSGAHFGNLKKLKKGAEIFLTDAATNTRLRYEVYDIETIRPDDFNALKESRGTYGLTLLTCQNDGNDRMILRCEQKDAA